MLRLTRLLRIYIWRSTLGKLAWRAFLITIVVEQAVAPLIGLAVWHAALPGSTTISTYYVALLVVQLGTVSFEHHTLANRIYGGDFSHDLLMPQPPILATLGENLALRIWHLVVGAPAIALTWLATGISFEPEAVELALPALALAATLRFLFIYTLALTAFWSQQAHGAVGFGETLIFLLGGSAAPIAVLPADVRPFAEWLPFRAMLGFPAEIASGTVDTSALVAGYGWQCLWLVILAAVARIVWLSGLRRFSAVGG